jgi:hypothetical protein
VWPRWYTCFESLSCTRALGRSLSGPGQLPLTPLLPPVCGWLMASALPRLGGARSMGETALNRWRLSPRADVARRCGRSHGSSQLPPPPPNFRTRRCAMGWAVRSPSSHRARHPYSWVCRTGLRSYLSRPPVMAAPAGAPSVPHLLVLSLARRKGQPLLLASDLAGVSVLGGVHPLRHPLRPQASARSRTSLHHCAIATFLVPVPCGAPVPKVPLAPPPAALSRTKGG